ncbi:MAG: DUF58 domain-containing protein [Phycisphaerales bacterium]
MYHGRHAAVDLGASTEFFDYRPYTPGDEVSRIDWKHYAKSDRLYVRRHRHFSDLTVHLVLDASASMDFASAESDSKAITKYDYARRIAASLAFLAVRQSDRVALTIARDTIVAAEPIGGSWPHLRRIVHALESVGAEGRSDLGEALTLAAEQVRQRRLVIVLSDFLDDTASVLDATARLRHAGNDVMAMQIITRAELDLTGVGKAELIDRESGERRRVDANRARDAYRDRVVRHIERLRSGLVSLGAEHRVVLTETPPIEALRDLLRRRSATSFG